MKTIQITADHSGNACIDGKFLLYTYSAGDCDTIRATPATDRDAEMLHGALYDYYQVTDGVGKGTIFVLPDGRPFAKTEGVHVVRVRMRGTYIGPDEEIKGETAILKVENFKIFAQFDNMNLHPRYSHAWMELPLSSFDLFPAVS